MGYCVCVAVELTQYPHKSYIPLQNAKKMVFKNGISCLCDFWVRLNTQTNRIFKCKTLKKWSFAMEYRVCVTVKSSQYPHKVYILEQTAKKWLFAMEYRVCVAVKTTQYPHKSYISFENAKKMVLCDGISCYTHTNCIFHRRALKFVLCYGISCMCDCWVDLITTQILYSIAKG